MTFTRINSKLVEARIVPGQRMFSQRGAMLAYRGAVSFTPSIVGGQGGVMSMIGRRVANEATPLMTVEGDGLVMFGHGGHHIHTVDLAGETLYVEADRLLAFDGSLAQGTMFMGSQGGVMGVIRGQVTGQGLFTTTLQGKGSVAVMAHGGVFELPITPAAPSTSTRRPTSPTAATYATSWPPPSAGARWSAAARARPSNSNSAARAWSTCRRRRRSCDLR